MKKKKQIKLSILYTRKVTIAGEGTLGFEKESIIRRTQDQYAIVMDEGVRYVIFENTDSAEPYIIVGRLMGGNKYKNYFLSAVPKEKFPVEVNSEILKKYLQNAVSETKGGLEKFKKFVKINFGIDYDHSAS